MMTWKQVDDARWFGGNIPGEIISLEVVTIDTANNRSYEKYAGTPLQLISSNDTQLNEERTHFILTVKASVMP